MAINIWDFQGVPAGLANMAFGGNLIAAQIVLTAFATLLITMPGIVARLSPDLLMFLAFLGVLVCTAIGWLDPSVFVIVIAVMALLYAGVVRKAIGA